MYRVHCILPARWLPLKNVFHSMNTGIILHKRLAQFNPICRVDPTPSSIESADPWNPII